jgi:hypothetical protein
MTNETGIFVDWRCIRTNGSRGSKNKVDSVVCTFTHQLNLWAQNVEYTDYVTPLNLIKFTKSRIFLKVLNQESRLPIIQLGELGALVSLNRFEQLDSVP